MFFDSSTPALVKNENGKSSGGRDVIKISRNIKEKDRRMEGMHSQAGFDLPVLLNYSTVFLMKIYNCFVFFNDSSELPN